MENKKASQQAKRLSALGPFLSLDVPVLFRVTSFPSRLKQITLYFKKLTCLLTHRITSPTVTCVTCPTTACKGTISVVTVSYSVTVVSICFTFIYVWLWKAKVIFTFLLCLTPDQFINLISLIPPGFKDDGDIHLKYSLISLNYINVRI